VSNAAAAFDNISIDLIYGVSERDNAHWRKDLQTALSLPIRHLSCYALTPEENSILYKQIERRSHAPVDDDLAAQQYQILLEMLPHSALQQYEISNFAVPGFESKHNSSYWNHTPYLGLGPAAHSFDGHSRQWNPANLKQYAENMAQGKDCEERETLTSDDLYNEALLLGLRTRAGVDLNTVATRFGDARRKELEAHFRTHVATEHYHIEKDRLCLTATGLWFADGIAQSAFLV
jgi:oxygen-independent coproporphyrinogen-3 oxidase